MFPGVEQREMGTLVRGALSGHDAECPNCKQARMNRTTDPDHIGYPSYLFITVARYATGGAKVTTKIKKASKFVYGLEDYELVGFTVHIGARATSGHYLGYLADGQKFDDHGGLKKDRFGFAMAPEQTHISPEEFKVAKEDGYCYLYKKVTNR